MRIDLSLGLLPLLLVALAAAASAQGQGQVIRGQVVDESGVPMSGIGVEFRDSWNAQVLGRATTDLTGLYTSSDLPAGTYRIRFWDELGAVPGKYVFPTYHGTGGKDVFCYGTDVVLEPGATVTVDQHLQLGTAPPLYKEQFIVTVMTLAGDTGLALEGVRVELIHSETAQALYSTTTDASGNCKISQGLLAETVVIRLSDPTGSYHPLYLGAAGKDEYCLALRVKPDVLYTEKLSLTRNTPAQQTEHLTDQIEAMPLPSQVSNVLATPLTRAADLLGDDNPSNDSGVCHQLDSFITRVAIQEKKGQLTATEAADLISTAKAIQQSMGCN